MRRIVLASLAALAALCIASPVMASSSAKPAPHWAAEQIEQVVAHGVMGPSVAEFRPDEHLTWGELAHAVHFVRGRFPRVRNPERVVRMAQLNAWLVRAARLSGAAKKVRAALLAAGLSPPRRVATETIARFAHFRIDHERSDEQRETAPNQPVSRAEAAYSFARLLELTRWERKAVKQKARSLALPQLTPLQVRVLDRALGVVGYPYVWAGASPKKQVALGQRVPGGFDCSGFSRYVYTGEPYAGAEHLGSMLVGRSTYALSGEFPRHSRVAFEHLQPADLVFFGDRGTKSKPGQVGHMGINLGSGWMVHSSRYGTTLTVFSDWYLERFAWGRNVLSEAGLQ